ncbi:MAG TPA: DUF6445 family protein [Asticcacaulis sp.]|nr:DUF6445 family protein [Asticcacaulis sp.]
MPDANPLRLTLNPRPDLHIISLGQEGQSALVADNVLTDPDRLRDAAIRAPFAAPPPTSLYPGMTAPLPDGYLPLLLSVLRRPMTDIFGMRQVRSFRTYGFLGLATLARDQMAPAQAAPHTDTHRLDSFASVHYLSPMQAGGTAFYRHRATGFELITPTRNDKFRRLRGQELAAGLDSKTAYEEIAYVEPRFNRLVLYRAGQLHSARLNTEAGLSHDPALGRLTANLFFNTEDG